jgi:serine/threonine-protein kinase RsbT
MTTARQAKRTAAAWPRRVEANVSIMSDAGVTAARERGRALARRLGFSPVEQVAVTSAISELAGNVLCFARSGDISVRVVESRHTRGIRVTVSDWGPGIEDPDRALADGFSTVGRRGLGLSGVRRMMDDFDIQTRSGQGTVVTVTKWLGTDGPAAA